MEELMKYISTIGFPIVVALYSLVKLNKTMEDNTKVMNSIATKLDLQNEKERIN